MKKLPQESWEKRIRFQSGHLYIDGIYASTNRAKLNKLIRQTLTSDRQRVVEEILDLINNMEIDTVANSARTVIQIESLIQQYKLKIKKEKQNEKI